MLAAMSPGKAQLTAIFAALLMTLGLASSAHADGVPGTWATAGSFPSGTTTEDGYQHPADQIVSAPNGGLLRFSINDGYPTLTPITGAGLGTPVHIPGAPSGAIPVQVSFLPSGDAIVGYDQFFSGPLSLVERFANGTYGPTLRTNHLDSGATSDTLNTFGSTSSAFAARPGEVLLAGGAHNSVDEVAVISLAIGTDGSMTPTAATPAVIYAAPGDPPDHYGTGIDVPVVALDTAGTADVLVKVDHTSESGNEILEIQRGASGSWGTPRSISAELTNPSFVGTVHAAIAPGGRELAIFDTGGTNAQNSYSYQALREPGQPFATPSLIVGGSRPSGSEQLTPVAASSGDGTLAVGVFSRVCNTTTTAETQTLGMNVELAAPGQPITGYSVGVTDSANAYSALSSFGAGGGDAIVGFRDQDNSGSTVSNVCNSVPDSTSGTVSDRVAIVGATALPAATFGSGQYNGGGNGSAAFSVDAVGIDCGGNAAATGRLAGSGVHGFSYLTAPTSFPAICAGAPTTPSPTPTPTPVPDGGPDTTTTTTTVAPTPAPAPGPTPVVIPPAPVNVSSLSPKATTPKLASNGTVSVTITAPHSDDPGFALGEHMAVQVFAGPAGNGARAAAASTKKKSTKKTAKPKLIGSVSKSVKLKSGQSLKVKLTLTSKLKKYIKANKKASVVLQITSTQTGRTPTITTKTIKH